MDSKVKQAILSQVASGRKLKVFTDPAASPTGFPFKVLEVEDDVTSVSPLATLSDPEVYNARPRVCNLGYLRVPYLQPNGQVGYKCAAEPIEDYVAKGGEKSATVGRKCLCNALCADAGFPQVRYITNSETGEKEQYVEPGLVTMGDDVNLCAELIKQNEDGTWGYSAGDVIDYLLSEWKEQQTLQHQEQLQMNTELSP